MANTRSPRNGARAKAATVAPPATPPVENPPVENTAGSATPAQPATPPTQAVATPAPKRPTKMRWQFPDGYGNRGDTGQWYTFEGQTVAIVPATDAPGKYHAAYTDEQGVQVLLVEAGSHASAYNACVKRHKAWLASVAPAAAANPAA